MEVLEGYSMQALCFCLFLFPSEDLCNSFFYIAKQIKLDAVVK